MKRKSKYNGFSLIELMIVIAITGMLATLSVSSFTKYKGKAKLSEAYQIFGAINTAQRTFFSENNRFSCSRTNDGGGGDRVKLGLTAVIDGGQPTIETAGTFTELGGIASVNANLNFAYNSNAGAFDSTGTEYPFQYEMYVETATPLVGKTWTGTACTVTNSGLAFEDFGINTNPGGEYFWYVNVAFANFSINGSECVQIVQSATFDGNHSLSPFIRLD